MTQDPGQTKAAAEQKKAELERGIEETRQKLAALLGQQKLARVQSLVATLVILVVILAYSYKGYSQGKAHYEANFTMDRIKQVWEGRKEGLIAKVKTVAQQAYDTVLPAYKTELTGRLKDIAPKAEANARRELDGLEAKVKADLTEVMNGSLANLEASLKEKLRKDFPAVANKPPEEAFAAFIDTMKVKLPDLQTAVETAVHDEGLRIQEVMGKFEVGDLTTQERKELEKQWVICLLDYAKYEFSVAGTDEALHFSGQNFWGDFFKQFEK